jgi:hypothetical protein
LYKARTYTTLLYTFLKCFLLLFYKGHWLWCIFISNRNCKSYRTTHTRTLRGIRNNFLRKEFRLLGYRPLKSTFQRYASPPSSGSKNKTINQREAGSKQSCARRYITEDRTLHNHRRENLKSYNFSSVLLNIVTFFYLRGQQLWVPDQMNLFIEHSQIVITTKYNADTVFHTTNHFTLIFSVYFQ